MVSDFDMVNSSHNVWVDDSNLLRLVNAVHMQVQQYTARNSVGIPQASSIPQVIHFIWLGSVLPEKYVPIIEGWRTRHPGWQVLVWDDTEAAAFMCSESERKLSSSQFHNATNYGMKSDILRYEILLSRGGVYVDIDYECVKMLGSAPWWCTCGAFAGWSNTSALEINNGIMGCERGHPLFCQIVSVISKNMDLLPTAKKSAIDFAGMDSVLAFLGADTKDLTAIASNDAAMKIIQCTGPGMYTRQVYAFLVEHELRGAEAGAAILILPRCVFHPVPNNVDVDISETQKLEMLKATWVRESTIAIHWWQRSWQQE